MKRTDKDTLNDINDAPDIQRLVADKRESKRATPAKGRRRNRRYENRILSAQVQDDFDNEGEDGIFEDKDRDSKFTNS
jgi:hypothetical protein